MLTEKQFEERIALLVDLSIDADRRAEKATDPVAIVEHNSERAAYRHAASVMRHGKV